MTISSDSTPSSVPLDPSMEEYHSLDNFTKLHRSQFTSMGLPENLFSVVHNKLYSDTFDVTDMCELEYLDDPDGESGFQVLTKHDCSARDDIWLLDHAWTTNYELAKQTLHETEGLLERLWTMCDMNYRLKKKIWIQKKKDRVERKNAVPDETPVTLDDTQIALLMEQASISDERAREVLLQAKGDLINAMQILQGEGISQEEQQLRHAMEQSINQQTDYKDTEQPLRLSEVVLPEYTREQKIDLLYDTLFEEGFFGQYYTMKAREEGVTGPVRADEVESVLYLNDEIGSGIAQHSINYNARLEPLVVVTLNGASFSLLWFIKDVEEGDEIIVKPREKVPKQPQIQPSSSSSTTPSTTTATAARQ